MLKMNVGSFYELGARHKETGEYCPVGKFELIEIEKSNVEGKIAIAYILGNHEDGKVIRIDSDQIKNKECTLINLTEDKNYLRFGGNH